MIIWMLIFLFGVVATVGGLFGLIVGIVRKQRTLAIRSVVIPILIWLGIIVLFEADRRFIAEETRKNGGVTPDWVW